MLNADDSIRRIVFFYPLKIIELLFCHKAFFRVYLFNSIFFRCHLVKIYFNIVAFDGVFLGPSEKTIKQAEKTTKLL